MNNDDLLKIGYVTEIEGRRVYIFVIKKRILNIYFIMES